MNILDAQSDMRMSYLRGGPGVVASGLIWLVAGITALSATQQSSIIVFFFGGMFIFPLGVLFSKILKRSGQHTKGNPLGPLAIESTLLLFIGLFIAYSIYQFNPNWFYPIMLLIIGGRYVLFQSMYGMRLYWIFGLVLTGAGVLCMLTNQPFHVGGIAGGLIELVFAVIIFITGPKER